MVQKNKGKYGGARIGSGRKSKAEELGLPALIDKVIGPKGKEKLIRKLRDEAEKGSFAHHQLLMAYAYGKPIERSVVKQSQEIRIVYDEGSDLIMPNS